MNKYIWQGKKNWNEKDKKTALFWFDQLVSPSLSFQSPPIVTTSRLPD
jgi:hypothetical protein